MSRKSKKRSSGSGSAQYDKSEIHYSSSWCIERFRSADKQREIDREQRKQAETDSIFLLIGAIEENKIMTFPAFLRYVVQHMPQYKVIATHNHQLFRNYIRDFSDYTKYFDEIVNKYKDREKQLENKYRILFDDEHRDHVEMITLLRNQRQDLIEYINRLTRSPDEVEQLNEIYSRWLNDAGLLSRVDETFSEEEQLQINAVAVCDAYNISDDIVPY